MKIFFIGAIIVFIIYYILRNKAISRYLNYQAANNRPTKFPYPEHIFKKCNRMFYVGIILTALISFFIPITTLLREIHIFGYILIVWGSYLEIKMITIDVVKEHTMLKNDIHRGKLFFSGLLLIALGYIIINTQTLPF
jgi:hypothetical protein